MIKNILFILFLFSYASIVHANCADPREEVKAFQAQGIVLTGPLIFENIEKEHLVVIEIDGKKEKVIFGYLNHMWIRVKKQISNGAKLYSISSSKEQWEKPLSGAVEGYAAIRNGCVVEAIFTSIS